MNKIIYIDSNLQKMYDDNGFWGKIKDKFNTKYEGESFIKNLEISILKVKLPPNFNESAFKRNIFSINKRFGSDNSILALKTFRKMDYYFYSELQKKIFAYSVVKSIQLILMTRKKSIKQDCILVYDAADDINKYIIYELAKKARRFILLSNNIKKTRMLCDYIVSNYGISPIVTNDRKYAVGDSDFIITSRSLVVSKKCPVWYLDNMYIPQETEDIAVNEVTYLTPWDIEGVNVTPELLGAVFSREKIKDIGEFLQEKEIFMGEIKFKSYKVLEHSILWKKIQETC
ncbi:hypothetical protein [Clostridium sp. ZS2-4]|uniref:hypothetical protein n=1 Tax=Clostridium sp. ZS2-4 TaxID=2987703 RepID=UPI00227C1A5B|nr:hypothetical protein [Clostridium sp. ZS2-4]MCY6356606.1 hypothetical protein [Clostridium sp. ZS2-4]